MNCLGEVERNMGHDTNLMIPQAQISDQSIISEDIVSKLLDARFIFKMCVRFQQSSIQFHDLTKSQLLSRRLVQPPYCLDELKVLTSFKEVKWKRRTDH